jgi:hypothetical protein
MANEWIAPLTWENAGTAPSDNLKTKGFEAGYKPPAAVFNYFLHKEQECIEQLQKAVDNTDTVVATKANAEHSHTLDDVSETAEKKILTADERSKLAGVAEGAEVNQNAFSNITVGSTQINAGGKTDTVVLEAGENVALAVEGKKITVSATDTVYSHPTTSGNKHIPSGGTKGQILRWAEDGTAEWGEESKTTYALATPESDGLMSADDKTKLDNLDLSLPIVRATTTDKIAYTGEAGGVSKLSAGTSVIFIPSETSQSQSPSFNLNGLGAKVIRRRLSNLSTSTQEGYAKTWLAANKAFLLIYDGTYWIVDGLTKPAAADLYGAVSIEKGGTGAETAAEALTNLGAASATDLEALLARIVTLEKQVTPLVVGAYYFNETAVWTGNDITETVTVHSVDDGNSTHASDEQVSFDVNLGNAGIVVSGDQYYTIYRNYSREHTEIVVDFGSTPQLVSRDFYDWLIANTTRTA